MLELRLLGTPTLHRDGVPLAVPIRKGLALLMRLACQAGPLPRGDVATLLWPGLDDASARRNLRRELARLREAGLGDAIATDGDRLLLGTGVRCDVHAFAEALDAGRHDEALALWLGEPAAGLVLGDADAFDDWLAGVRQRLGAQRQGALRARAAAREAAGDFDGALACVDALLADDPLQEQHHRDAMRLLAASGRREAALARHDRCRQLLRDELGLEPMAETTALAVALRRGGRSPPPERAPPEPAPAHPVLLPQRLPFVGRDAEVRRLEDAWREGRTVVVEGEAGVGKTRLALDFASSHGPYVLARCRPEDGEQPYASFTRALRTLTDAGLAGLPDWVTAELCRLLPEHGPAPPPIRSDEERNRFLEACAQAWQRSSDESFDAVVLDDWHLADPASRRLLAFIAKRRTARGPHGARELLVQRPSEAADGDLHDLAAATSALHLRLEPLDADALLELVSRLSGARSPRRFAERLARATGGNPFFVAETLRHWVELRLLAGDGRGGWHTPFDADTEDYRELPLPRSVIETVLARVGRLPEASRRLLEAAAVATEPFAPALLAPACALSEVQALLAIEAALAARLLREHEAGGYAFEHDLVQQALGQSLPTERRRLVHRRLALGAEAASAPASLIARHHEASGDTARAVAHRLRAGDDAQRLHALAEAMQHWQRALDDGPTPADTIRLRDRLCLVGQQRADLDAVRAQADALAALVEGGTLRPHERVDAILVRAHALIASGQQQRALAELDALPAGLDGAARTRFLQMRSTALHNLGRTAEALHDAEAALAQPDLADRDRIELLDLVFIAHHGAGRVPAALAAAEAALVASLRIGHVLGVARSRYRRGIQRLQLDDITGAEADLQAAADDSERLGFVNLLRVVLYNLSCLHAKQDRPADALAAARRGWTLEPPIQAPTMRAMYGLAMLEAQQALGELGAAWEAARQVVADALAQDDPTVRLLVAGGALELLAWLGESARARDLLSAVDATPLDGLVNVAAGMWIARARLELHAGDRAAAAHALERVEAARDAIEPRAALDGALARASLCLARGDVAGAREAAPDPADPRLGSQLRLRAWAVRLGVERLAGAAPAAAGPEASSLEAALAPPHGLSLAALALHRALAAATADDPSRGPAAATARDACLDALARTLDAHPAQQAAFQHCARGTAVVG